MCISSVSFLPQELPGPQEGLRVLELPALEGKGGRGKGRRKGWGGEEIGKERGGVVEHYVMRTRGGRYHNYIATQQYQQETIR